MKILHFSLLFAVLLCCIACQTSEKSSTEIRLGLFNIKELSTKKLMETDSAGIGINSQLVAARDIIQQIRPDILVINEIDHDWDAVAQGESLLENPQRFLHNYLQQGKQPLEYAYIYAAPCNTGFLSGFDLNNDGVIATEADRGGRGYGDDCYGYGAYPGQYSMALFSKYPIDSTAVRTFQKFLWKALPGNHLPHDFYSPEEIAILRLSSKSHWDVPIEIDGTELHVLLSHPTPPVFDGPEDRNGRRNFDEIKFWNAYISGGTGLYDDTGNATPFSAKAQFVIIGDLNASTRNPAVYDSVKAIDQLLKNPRVQESGPFLTSKGALRGVTAGAPDFFERATTEFRPGDKHRIDYILPSTGIKIIQGGVYWPDSSAAPADYQKAQIASDHHMIWLDVQLNNE